MRAQTARKLSCPVPRGPREKIRCAGKLEAWPTGLEEIEFGRLECSKCSSQFPILAGVAIVVEDVGSYLAHHVKGISQQVPLSRIPEEFQSDYGEALEEFEESRGTEHIEEDLEAERVNALYLMNHYLRASGPVPFWASSQGGASPLIEQLVRTHWDSGPFAVIRGWLTELKKDWRPETFETVELGCGVGGLHRELQEVVGGYLGVDSSFASIALARHLSLGAPWKGELRIPEDLLQGPVSRKVRIAPSVLRPKVEIDFVVGDLEAHPVRESSADCCITLNTIDMLEEPERLPRIQKLILKDRGVAVQTCPYIWHERIARKLRSLLPRGTRSSSQAAEALYEKSGFEILRREEHVPWLFLKHLRQLEVYSVHAFLAVRGK
jgi:SAM-dependent methyltransferase